LKYGNVLELKQHLRMLEERLARDLIGVL